MWRIPRNKNHITWIGFVQIVAGFETMLSVDYIKGFIDRVAVQRRALVFAITRYKEAQLTPGIGGGQLQQYGHTEHIIRLGKPSLPLSNDEWC